MKKKFSYRKKGKFADGTTKIVIEMRDNKKVIGSVNLPKPERLWVALKRPDISKEKEDIKNSELRETKVNDNKEVRRWNEKQKQNKRRN